MENIQPAATSARNMTIQIGRQNWMPTNLNVATFRNGDPIPQVTSAEGWERVGLEGKPAWSYYQNDSTTAVKYGRLYNWHAVNDPRGLAPEGWHIPTNEEWIQLEEFVGTSIAGSQLKCDSLIQHNHNNHQRKFCVLPGGYRDRNGNFTGMGEFTYFTSISQVDSPELNGNVQFTIWGRGLHVDNTTMMRCELDKRFGLYVRVIKD